MCEAGQRQLVGNDGGKPRCGNCQHVMMEHRHAGEGCCEQQEVDRYASNENGRNGGACFTGEGRCHVQNQPESGRERRSKAYQALGPIGQQIGHRTSHNVAVGIVIPHFIKHGVRCSQSR